MDAQKMLEQAAAHQRAGRLQEAEQLLEKIARNQPNNEVAVRALAMLQARSGRLNDAQATLRKALEVQPHNPHLHEMLGDIQLRLDPRAAEESARAGLRLSPSSAPLCCLLGDALVAQRKMKEAVDAYQLAIRIRPKHSFPQIRLAQALRLGGHLNDAIAVLKRAAEVDRSSPEARHALGVTLMEADRLEEAEAAFRESISLKADYIPGYGSLGMLLQRLGRLEEGEQIFREAIGRQPNQPLLHLSVGHLLLDMGRTEEAEAAYRRAIELDGRFAAAWVSLSSLYMLKGRLAESLAAAQQAVQVGPGFPEAQGALGTALQAFGQAEQATGPLARAWELGGSPAAGSNLLHTLNYVTGMLPQEVFNTHRAWAQRHADSIPAVFKHENSRDPQRRLKIGYVSPDFRGHAVSFFVEPLLMGHDRSQVEVYCYSAVGRADAVTERLKSHADQWREIARLGDQRAAELVHNDGIDILIDLAGHTNGNRLGIFARRPAPVQVTYQGYPNTTGMSAIQYRFTDAHADPPGMSEQFHTEQLVRLPRTAWCYRPPEPSPEVADLPARRNGYVTFGSFNRLAKVSAITAELWSRVVKAVPGSKLLFKTAGLDEPATAKFVRELFARFGLEGDRLVLMGAEPNLQKHLERYGEIDIALDCYPYHGTTTSCEAMWMGVPSIVLIGVTHVSRVGLSLLTNIGVPELAAMSADQFVEIAGNLAGDLDRLAELRHTMRQRMQSSPLMDVGGFCREIEEAYRNIWRGWCAGG